DKKEEPKKAEPARPAPSPVDARSKLDKLVDTRNEIKNQLDAANAALAASQQKQADAQAKLDGVKEQIAKNEKTIKYI
ncbi:hypothetical protein, partial [Winkia sp. UMB3105]